MAVVAIYLPEAQKGNARAGFYVATAYCLEAAKERRKRGSEIRIRGLEDRALRFYRLAEKGADSDAHIMMNQIRKNGRAALYFVSIEHIFETDDPRVRNPEQFYQRIKPDSQKR